MPFEQFRAELDKRDYKNLVQRLNLAFHSDEAIEEQLKFNYELGNQDEIRLADSERANLFIEEMKKAIDKMKLQ